MLKIEANFKIWGHISLSKDCYSLIKFQILKYLIKFQSLKKVKIWSNIKVWNIFDGLIWSNFRVLMIKSCSNFVVWNILDCQSLIQILKNLIKNHDLGKKFGRYLMIKFQCLQRFDNIPRFWEKNWYNIRVSSNNFRVQLGKIRWTNLIKFQYLTRMW